MANAPIADLSYRGYDGPLESPTQRWWVIAKTNVRRTFKNKWYWVATITSGWYYLLMMIIVYFVELAAESNPRQQGPFALATFMKRVIWVDQFVHGLSWAQIMIFVVTLIAGAGVIANDNRANALLVYLSRPCSKLDYVIGKFIGVFLPILLTVTLPSLIYFLYGALSYRAYGFLSNDPWMIVKLLIVCPLIAAFYSALIIGVSSLFNQGRMAGAAFAGIYFLTNFFTQMMVIAWQASTRVSRGVFRAEDGNPIAAKLYYASVDGTMIGATKAIMNTDGSPYFGLPSPVAMIPAPPLIPMLLISGIVMFLCLWLAWSRIRAVEVVK